MAKDYETYTQTTQSKLSKLSKQQKPAAIYEFIFLSLYRRDERGDIKADSVHVGLQGAVSDLHVADAK